MSLTFKSKCHTTKNNVNNTIVKKNVHISDNIVTKHIFKLNTRCKCYRKTHGGRRERENTYGKK